MTPEGKVKKKVTLLLKELGVWYFFPGNNGYGRSGIPDIVACVNGHFVGIECKADPSKQPTALQLKEADGIMKSGGTWILVSDDISLEILENLLTDIIGVDNHDH